MSESQAPSLLPVLALKNVVLYPKLVLPLSVGREASRAAVDVAIDRHEGEILLVAQRDPSMESPGASDLYEVGTRAKIRKVLRTSAQSMEIIV